MRSRGCTSEGDGEGEAESAKMRVGSRARARMTVGLHEGEASRVRHPDYHHCTEAPLNLTGMPRTVSKMDVHIVLWIERVE